MDFSPFFFPSSQKFGIVYYSSQNSVSEALTALQIFLVTLSPSLYLETMTSKRSEVIRLRDILSKIPGVTKILWTELCAIVHDRLEKGKVRLSLYPPISFFSTLNLKQTKKSGHSHPQICTLHISEKGKTCTYLSFRGTVQKRIARKGVESTGGGILFGFEICRISKSFGHVKGSMYRTSWTYFPIHFWSSITGTSFGNCIVRNRCVVG